MKVALYARYSTSKQREASIVDQYRICEKYAGRENWQVTHRYKDQAISGSDSSRPGYQHMLKDAKAGLFDVLLMNDLSRLSRDQVESEQTMRKLEHWGIRVIGVSDGYDSSSGSRKVHRGVKGLFNEIYLDDLAVRTHAGLTGQAKNGFNCGGRSYGYKHVPIEDPTKTDNLGRPLVAAVKREIDKEQAKIIHRIFKMYADGFSPRWIANKLNEEGIPSPRGKKWSSTAIYGHPAKSTGILNNPLYVGKYIWNRSQWLKDPEVTDRKKTVRRERPESEWITTELPELRIIPQALWDHVKNRQAAIHTKSIHIREALHKNARTGAGPKYLFSSILKCDECGGNFIIAGRDQYGCSTHIHRGKSACGNNLRVSRSLVEDKLLAGIKSDLFTDEAFRYFKKETTRLLRERRVKEKPQKKKAAAELAKVTTQIDRMVEAIAAGTFSPALQASLEAAEKAKAGLEKELAMDSTQIDRIPDLLPLVAEEHKRLVNNLGTVTQREVARARTQVAALVGKEIRLVANNGHLVAELQGDLGGLLQVIDLKGKLNVVAGAGFEPTTFGL